MSVSSHNKSPRQDWHPADIKAALAKAGYSFARLARENGYADNSPNMVLHKPWSQIEALISRIIKVPAAEIWPSRYDRRGRPLKARTSRVNPRSRTQTERVAKRSTVSNV